MLFISCSSWSLFYLSQFFSIFFPTAEEFLYRNQWGGISLLNAVNLSERVLMSNFTYVSIISQYYFLVFFISLLIVKVGFY